MSRTIRAVAPFISRHNGPEFIARCARGIVNQGYIANYAIASEGETRPGWGDCYTAEAKRYGKRRVAKARRRAGRAHVEALVAEADDLRGLADEILRAYWADFDFEAYNDYWNYSSGPDEDDRLSA